MSETISGLNPASASNLTDLTEVSQVSGSGYITKKVAESQRLALVNDNAQLASTSQVTGFASDVDSLANAVAVDLIKLTYLTPFVVGATSTYTSVQAAINAAASSATSVNPLHVLITAGTYTENLSLKSNVHLISCGSPASVKIIGNTIFNPTGSGQLVECTGITFQTPASASGAAFSVQGSNFGDVNIHNCTFNGTTGTAVECTNANSNFNILDCQINSFTGYSAYNCTGGIIEVINSFTTGSTTASTISSNGQIDFTGGTVLDSFVLTGTAICVINNVIAQSPSTNSFININSGCTANIFNSSITCGALLGYWATGLGTLQYNNLSASLGTANKIDPGLTINEQTLLTNNISLDGGATLFNNAVLLKSDNLTGLANIIAARFNIAADYGYDNTTYRNMSADTGMTNPISTYIDFDFTASGKKLSLPPMNAVGSMGRSGAGRNFWLRNVGGYSATIAYNSGSTIVAINPGDSVNLFVTGNGSADGSVIYYLLKPYVSAPLIQGKQEMLISGSAFFGAKTSGAVPDQQESSTNKNNYLTGAQLAQSGLSYAHYRTSMPHNWDLGTLTAILTCKTPATTGNAILSLQAIVRNNGEAEDQAFGSAVNVTIAASGTAQNNIISSESSAITPACSSSPAANCELELRISRNGGAGSDTLANYVNLAQVKLFWTANAGNAA